ncbi:MAG: transposase, partial [Varibaculum cambriense]|nr:transposase [Varibaculum cambriense]
MSWNRQNYWCWRVDPVIEPTGQIYDYIQIDGTYLPYGWCLLTAVNNGKVLAWQWCNQENKTAYKQLLKRLPEPLMVITDGQAGALSAIKDQWPNTRIQRCLVHIKRNIRTLTTEPYWVLFRFLYGGQFVDPCLIIAGDYLVGSSVS